MRPDAGARLLQQGVYRAVLCVVARAAASVAAVLSGTTARQLAARGGDPRPLARRHGALAGVGVRA